MASRTPSSRGPGLGWVLLVMGILGGVGIWWTTRGAGKGVEVGPEVEKPESGTGLGGRLVEGVEDVDPFPDAKGPYAAEEARGGLTSRLEVRRIAALQAIVDRGTTAHDLGPTLERLAQAQDPVEALWARGAQMKVDGNRRFMADLATKAAEAPSFATPSDIVRRLDPVSGEALLRAAAEARKRRENRDLGTVAGLEEAAASLAADPTAGRAAVAAALSQAGARDLPVWLSIAGGLRPLPLEACTSLADRLRRGSPDEQALVMAFLSGSEAQLAAAGDDLGAALLERVGTDGASLPLLRAVARLPRLDETGVRRLLDVARTRVDTGANVVFALRDLGPKAVGAGAALVAWAPEIPEERRGMLVEPLLAIGDTAALSYAADRLASAPPAERGAWVAGLAEIRTPKDATPVIPALASVIAGTDEGRAGQAARAIARVDPTLAVDGAAAAFAAALGDARASVRAAAAGASGMLTALPPPVASALVARLDDDDASVRSAAIVSAISVGRLGSAGAPFLEAVLRLWAAPDRLSDVPDGAARALRTLASIDPLRAEVRAACLAKADDPDPGVRTAAVWGLGRLRVPSPTEKAAVLRAKDDPALGALARSILARPTWQSVSAPSGGSTSTPHDSPTSDGVPMR